MSEPSRFFGDADADGLLAAYLAHPFDWVLLAVLADRLEDLSHPDMAGWRWLADHQRHPAMCEPGGRHACLWFLSPRRGRFDRSQASFFLPWQFYRHARGARKRDDKLYYPSRTAGLAGAARAMLATPPPF